PFFSPATATPQLYPLSLHDALPICVENVPAANRGRKADHRFPSARPAMSRGIFVTGTDTGVGKTVVACAFLRALRTRGIAAHPLDRKSTRLNSSHVKISYAVFCLKK